MSLLQPPPMPFGEWAGLYFTMTTGSNVTVTSELNGIAATNVTIDEGDGYGGSGYIILSPQQLGQVGTHIVTIEYDNLVTVDGTDTASLFVEYRCVFWFEGML